MAEGGGRRGLPQSFLSRFSRVYVEAMDEADMREIATQAWRASGGGGGVSDGDVASDADATPMSTLTPTPYPTPAPVPRSNPSIPRCVLKLIPRMVAFVRALQVQYAYTCNSPIPSPTNQ